MMRIGRRGRRRLVLGTGVLALGIGVGVYCWGLAWPLPSIPATFLASELNAPAMLDENALFSVRLKGHYGFIDRTGKLVIEAKFTSQGEFSEGLAGMEKGGRYGFIDRTGTWVIQPAFTMVGNFVGSLAPVRDMNGNWGYMRPDGSWAISPRFEAACDFDHTRRALVGKESIFGKIKGLAEASSGDDWTWRWIDTSGRTIGTLPNWARPVTEPGAIAPVLGSGGFGYQDADGQFVILPSFAQAYPFSEGLAPVEVAGRGWGYIDPKGTLVIQPAFSWGYEFHNGLAEVAVHGKAGYIDRQGNWVWRPSD